MKLLKAKLHIEFKVPFDVTNVSLDNMLISTDMDWLNKRYPIFKESIDRVGMLFPIIYTDIDNYWLKEKRWPRDENGEFKNGYIVHTGNKRVIWAKNNGYTHIEGYFVRNKDEQSIIVKRTYVNKFSFPVDDTSFEQIKRRVI